MQSENQASQSAHTVREQIRNAMQCDDREHLESEDFEACYNCQVDKVMKLITTHTYHARIDELEALHEKTEYDSDYWTVIEERLSQLKNKEG